MWDNFTEKLLDWRRVRLNMNILIRTLERYTLHSSVPTDSKKPKMR